MPGKKKQTKPPVSPRAEGNPNSNNNNNNNNNNSADKRPMSSKEISQKVDECCELICSSDDGKIKRGLEELIRLKKEFKDKLDLNTITVLSTKYPLLAYAAISCQDCVAVLMLLDTKELEIDPNKTIIMPLRRPLIHYVCSDERPEAFAISGLLMSRGTRIDPNDESTIRAAAKTGHKDVLEWVLKNNPTVVHKIYRDKNATSTLLFDTLECKDIDNAKLMIDLLLKYGADINQKCTMVMKDTAQAYDVTLLQRLYLARNIARHTEGFIVFLVERNADFNLIFVGGRTPFQEACYSGHLNVIKAMLAKDRLVGKEDIVNQPFANGFPPIFWACQTDNLDLFNLLIINGAKINGIAHRLTLLEYAAAQGAYQIVKCLIEKFNFDANPPPTAGPTPLYLAIKGNRYPVVQLLLEKNANPNQLMGNDTIMDIAVTALSKAISASDIKETLNIISELLKYNAMTTLEQSAIIFKQACKERNLTVITQILQANNNLINKSISITDTFLTYAIQTKNVGVIKTVLAAGEMSAEPIDTSALVVAACRENVELEFIKALLRDGKDKLPMDQLIIALDIAISYGNNAVTNFFIEQDPQGITARAREIGNTRVVEVVSKYSPKHLVKLNVCCKLICMNDRDRKKQGIEGLINLKKELGSQLDLNSIKVMDSDFPLLGYIVNTNNPDFFSLSLLMQKQNELGIDVDETEMPDGRSLLSWICAKNTRADIEVSRCLISHGATIDANDDDTIRSATRNGHLEVLTWYLENNPTAVSKIYTTTNGETVTLLYETLSCPYIDAIKHMVEVLLKYKANIDQQYTIIHHQKLQSVTLLQQLFLERQEAKNVDVYYYEFFAKFLVERKADFNLEIVDIHTTPFQIACTFGYLESIKLMLAHGAEKNQIFSNGLIPLFCVCEQDSVEAFDFLLSQSADIDYIGPNGLTVFDYACAKGAYAITKKLIEEYGFDVNSPSAKGLTPLYNAVSAKNYYLTQLLLQNGANPTQAFGENNETIISLVIKILTEDQNAFGVDSFDVINELLKYVKAINALETAIACKNTEIANFLLANHLQDIAVQACKTGSVDAMDAVMNFDLEYESPVIQPSILSYATLACEHGHKNILEFFIKNGLITNIDETRDNYTLLYITAAAGKEDVVKFLLDKRATVGQACTDAMTALHIACQNGHVGVVEVLLSKGAKKFIYCKNQITPLSLAFHYEHFAVVDKLCADIKDRDMFLTQTVLHACQQGDLALIQYLHQKHGALKLNLSIENGMTPLHIACQYGQIDIVNWLLDNQIDNINGTNAAGQTPLHIACQYARAEIAVTLIKRGADVKLSTHIAGETPLYLACDNNETGIDVVEALLDAGADVDQRHSKTESTPRKIAMKRADQTVSAFIKNRLSPLEKMLGMNPYSDADQKVIVDFINNNDLPDTGITPFLEKIANDKSSQTVLVAERFEKLLPHIHALKRRVIVIELEKYKKLAKPADVIVDSVYQSKQETEKTSKPKTADNSTTFGPLNNNVNNNNASVFGVSAHRFFKDNGGTDEEWRIQKEQERKDREEAEKASKKIVATPETAPKITHTWGNGNVTSDMPEIKQVCNATTDNCMFYCPEGLIKAEFDLFTFDEATVNTIGENGGRGIKHIGEIGIVDIEFAGKTYKDCKVQFEYKIKNAKYRLFLVELQADGTSGTLYAAFLFHKAIHTKGVQEDLGNMFRKINNENPTFKISPPKPSPSAALSPTRSNQALNGPR